MTLDDATCTNAINKAHLFQDNENINIWCKCWSCMVFLGSCCVFSQHAHAVHTIELDGGGAWFPGFLGHGRGLL